MLLLRALGLGVFALAAQTESLTIQGRVPASTAITVTGFGNFNTLDLTKSQTRLKVASVTEQSNVATGYTVTMASANAGSLKNGVAAAVSYTAQYDNATVKLSATPQLVTSAKAGAGIVNVTKPLTVSYVGQPPATLASGVYGDTLTFTIAAK